MFIKFNTKNETLSFSLSQLRWDIGVYNTVYDNCMDYQHFFLNVNWNYVLYNPDIQEF